jgi:hypothetical protein
MARALNGTATLVDRFRSCGKIASVPPRPKLGGVLWATTPSVLVDVSEAISDIID